MIRWALIVLSACGRVGFDDADLAGLVVKFSFEGAPESPIVDSVSGHPGTCTPPGCPTPVPGHSGQGYHFDGVDDCIAIADEGHLDPPELSISLWANHDVLGVMMTHVAKPLIASTCDSWEIEPPLDGTPAIVFTTDHTGTCLEYLVSTTTVMTGTWYHIAATWDGAVKRLYIDGVEVASVGEPAPIIYDTSGAYIGCDSNGTILKYFQGTLDEIELYDRALAPEEIASLASH